MPNRILKESICTSDSIDSLSWFEEVLFYRLMVSCDDYGRFDGRASIIKNRLFPLKENLTIKGVSAAINTLARNGLVALYEFEGKPYLYLPTWNEHQNIRAKKSKYPSPDESVNTSEIICNQMRSDASKCSRNPIQSNPNPNPNTNTKKPAVAKFAPPTVEEVKAYCQERKNSINPQAFVDYYDATGWVQGKGKPIKDWKATVRTWENRDMPKRSNGPAYTAPSEAQIEESKKDMERMRALMARMKEDE